MLMVMPSAEYNDVSLGAAMLGSLEATGWG